MKASIDISLLLYGQSLFSSSSSSSVFFFFFEYQVRFSQCCCFHDVCDLMKILKKLLSYVIKMKDDFALMTKIKNKNKNLRMCRFWNFINFFFVILELKFNLMNFFFI